MNDITIPFSMVPPLHIPARAVTLLEIEIGSECKVSLYSEGNGVYSGKGLVLRRRLERHQGKTILENYELYTGVLEASIMCRYIQQK